jgi:PhnB protein
MSRRTGHVLLASLPMAARPGQTVHYISPMTDPTPYILFPGTAREALTFYGDVFGCAVKLHTFAEFNRSDGPSDAIAHGYLAEGPVALSGADDLQTRPWGASDGQVIDRYGLRWLIGFEGGESD